MKTIFNEVFLYKNMWHEDTKRASSMRVVNSGQRDSQLAQWHRALFPCCTVVLQELCISTLNGIHKRELSY